jgi:hypothetical protein
MGSGPVLNVVRQELVVETRATVRLRDPCFPDLLCKKSLDRLKPVRGGNRSFLGQLGEEDV